MWAAGLGAGPGAAGVRGEELWARRVWVSRRKYFGAGHSIGGQAVPMVVSMGVTAAPSPGDLEQEGERIESSGSPVAVGLSPAGGQEGSALRNV